MKRILISVVIVLSLFTPFFLSSQSSYIQVKSESGISVFLDGTFQGITNSEVGGLILKNVKPGERKVKIVKEGYNTQEKTINIRSDEVYVYEVSPLTPRIDIIQSGNISENSFQLETGILKIVTLPVDVNIKIPDYKIKSNKYESEWIAKQVPAGSFNIIISWNNKELKYEAHLKPSHILHLFIDMIELEVDIVSDTLVELYNDISRVNHRPLYKSSAYFDDESDNRSLYSPGGNGVSYGLGGRGSLYLDSPAKNFEEIGEVKVTIWVHRNGEVIDAQIDYSGTTILDQQQRQQAIEAAMNSRFESKQDAPERQRGFITYTYIK